MRIKLLPAATLLAMLSGHSDVRAVELFPLPHVQVGNETAPQLRRLPPTDNVQDPAIELRGDTLVRSVQRSPVSAAATVASTTNTASQGTSEDSAPVKPIGTAPDDNTQVFLRQAAVLLPPGKVETELGFTYTYQELDFLTLLPDASLVKEDTDRRYLVGTLALRYGLADRWQPYVTLPIGAGFFEQTNVQNQHTDEYLGLGDVTAGFNYLLRDGEDEKADIVLNVGFIAPTGDSLIGSTTPNTAPLGSGFWATSINVNFIRSFDPVVVFCSVGHSHQFSREYFGIDVQPGEILNYGLGIGFAVNDDLTLSSQLQSALQFDTRVNGRRVPDSNTEASTLRHSVIVRHAEQAFVELYLAHGLTADAPQTSIGILQTKRF